MNKNYTLILFLILCSGMPAVAQATDEAAVTAVIRKLFAGMLKGDSAMVHETFARNVTMATVYRDKNNQPALKQESSIRDFLKQVGTPHTDAYREEIWNIKVQIDGELAQVWCDYAFYLGSTFSHCGVDAFQLHKGKDGWRIFHLADTRRKEPCAMPTK